MKISATKAEILEKKTVINSKIRTIIVEKL